MSPESCLGKESRFGKWKMRNASAAACSLHFSKAGTDFARFRSCVTVLSTGILRKSRQSASSMCYAQAPFLTFPMQHLAVSPKQLAGNCMNTRTLVETWLSEAALPADLPRTLDPNGFWSMPYGRTTLMLAVPGKRRGTAITSPSPRPSAARLKSRQARRSFPKPPPPTPATSRIWLWRKALQRRGGYWTPHSPTARLKRRCCP